MQTISFRVTGAGAFDRSFLGWIYALGLLVASCNFGCFVRSAQAQSGATDAHRFRMADGSNDGFALSRPSAFGSDQLSFRLGFDYALNPLAFESIADNGDSESFRLVEHQLFTQISAAYTLSDRLMLSIGIPLQLLAQGQTPQMNDPAVLQSSGSSFALGDIAISARFRILGGSNDLVKLGISLSGYLPSASWADGQQRWLGNKNAALAPQLLLEIGNTHFRWTSNIGVLAALGSSQDQVQISDTRRSSGIDLRYASSLVWTPIFDTANALEIPRLSFLVEGYGGRSLEQFEAAVASPLEVLFGIQAQPVNGLLLGFAAGPGLGRGLGTPDFRSVLTVGFQELKIPPPVDTDGDGFQDYLDTCPESAEDIDNFEDDDGCPDPDNDSDGVLDALDHCPTGPEDRDGFQDDDGCPEPDNDRDTISDANDQCPLEPEDLDGFDDANGCPDPDNDLDGVLDDNDACPLEPGQTSPDPALNGCSLLVRFDALRGRIDVLERIEFRLNSTEVLPNLQVVLAEVGRLLQRNPGIRRLRLEGHADNRGPDAHNLQLAGGRARSVRAWFVAQGFPESQFEIWTCGEMAPRAANDTTGGRQQNRRVEFHVSNPPPVQGETTEGCEQLP